MRSLSTVGVAVILFGAVPALGANYLMNPSGNEHWTYPSFSLEYTGSGSSATYVVDGASNRFQTYVDTVLDVNVDLTDLANYKTLGQLVNYLDGLPDYSAALLSQAGGYTPATSRDPNALASSVTDLNTGGNELKQAGGYGVQVGWPNAWGYYNSPDPYCNVFGRTSTDPDRAISVRDVQTADSPNIRQQVHNTNPDWMDLLGKEVVISGYAKRFETSGSNLAQVRLHTGTGGGTVYDHQFDLPIDGQWHYFETDPWLIPATSDTIMPVLFWGPISQIYAGTGWVLYDDLVMTPEPGTIGLLAAGGLAFVRRRRRP